MPNYAKHSKRLETATQDFSEVLAQLQHAVQTGRDSYESAARVAVLAKQVATAEARFWDALSVVHSDNLSLDEGVCENSDDFADWTRTVARSRSYGPAPTVNLAHFLQAAE